MISLAEYSEIVQLMHKCGSRECLNGISEKYPWVSLNTLGSIYSQEYQKKMRKIHHLHYNADAMEKYYQEYLYRIDCGQSGVLTSLADQIGLSPALLSRIVLEKHVSHKKYNGENAPKSYVTQLMKDTALIDDGVLANEVYSCIVADDHYGPVIDTIKHSVGHEYEFRLKRELDSMGLAYIGEEQMRAKGYDKTPDIKLEVPIAVDGHVVNWIESKASFGDEYSHKNYEKDQFWSYWNRFGPGMVIYWFGFIQELDNNREKGIMLEDHLPADIVTMVPSVRTNNNT